MFQWKDIVPWSRQSLPDSLINFCTFFVSQDKTGKKVPSRSHLTVNYLKMDVCACGCDYCFRTLNRIQFEAKQSQLSWKWILLPAALALDKIAEWSFSLDNRNSEGEVAWGLENWLSLCNSWVYGGGLCIFLFIWFSGFSQYFFIPSSVINFVWKHRSSKTKTKLWTKSLVSGTKDTLTHSQESIL